MPRSDVKKQAWKAKLEATKDQPKPTFSYKVSDFDTNRFLSTEAVITIRVNADGSIECADPNCVEAGRHEFGKSKNTRGEYNAHKHLLAYHQPPLKLKGKTAGGRKPPGQSKSILAFGGFSRTTTPASAVCAKSQEKSNASSSSNSDSAIISKKPATSKTTEGNSNFGNVGHNNDSRKRPHDSSSDDDVASCESIREGELETPIRQPDPQKIAKRIASDSPLSSSKQESLSTEGDSDASSPASSMSSQITSTNSTSTCSSSSSFRSNPSFPLPRWGKAISDRVDDGTTARLCQGADILLPSPPYRNYPMSIEQVVPGISQKFIFDFGLQNVISASCARLSFELNLTGNSTSDSSIDSDISAPFRCSSCIAISRDPLLLAIIDRAGDSELHLGQVNHAYLTESQKDRRLGHHISRNNSLKLEALNSNRKLESVCKRRDEQKRLVAAFAEGDIPRVRQILIQAARKGQGVSATIEILAQARNGKYHPKGYSPQELDEAILVWKLGSSALLYAENHSFIKGGPSLRTIQRHANIPIYIPMYSDIVYNTVKMNYERLLFDPRRHSPSDALQCLRVMMIDDVKAEARGRYCNRSGRIVGLCGCAAKNDVSTIINSAEDCEAIARALDSGDVHLATEITNVAIAPIREKDYQTTFVATSAGCLSHDPPERLEHLMRASITTYVGDDRGETTLGRLSTVQSDGAGDFVLLGHGLFFREVMTDKHPLYNHLSILPLFNLHTGSGDYSRVTMGCEQKHVFKRTKERIKGEVGITMLNFKFTGSFLQDLLISTKTLRDDEIKTIFNVGFADAMNVPAMVKLYRAIADMAELHPSAFGERQSSIEAVREELRLLGKFCDTIWTVLCDKTPSLGAQLENISFLAHFAFVCYRRNGTKFLPSQNYANLQRYFRSIYWSIANAIEDGIPEYFLFQDSGDRLEEAYGLLRCLNGGASGNGSGMDVLQCTERIAGVMAVQGVLARNPHLRKASRHLRASDDHQNPRSFLSDGNGGQDRRRVDVDGISLQHKFVSGRSTAKCALVKAGFSLGDVDWNEIAKEKDVDLLRPKGKFVGITERDDEVEKPGGKFRFRLIDF